MQKDWYMNYCSHLKFEYGAPAPAQPTVHLPAPPHRPHNQAQKAVGTITATNATALVLDKGITYLHGS